MLNIISNDSYTKDGVFHIDDTHFAYSDGDTNEYYIKAVIDNATDISSNSKELESYIKDWSSRYHLSSNRSNAYKALNLRSSHSVLEIGSGCGAISRYLGENVGSLLSIEGSSRRAQITRSRTRDLKNVEVLCASFEEINFKSKFDLIVCNGVLEYSRLFVSDSDPFDFFLEKLSHLLTENGVLVIAIENKFGLRYFSNGKEDHTSRMYDGIEGYNFITNGPYTFGRNELLDMTNKYFSYSKMLLPFPDYKFPKVTLNSDLIHKANFAEVISQSEDFNYPTYVKPNFYNRLAWYSLQKSKQLIDFSNSFFLLVSNDPITIYDENKIGTIIKKSSESTKDVILNVCHDLNSVFIKYELEGKSSKISTWIDGISIHTCLVKKMLQASSNIEKHFNDCVDSWWYAVKQHELDDALLPNYMIDAVWHNCLYLDKEATFIDLEEYYQSKVPKSLLIYRAVKCFLSTDVRFSQRWNFRYQRMTPLSFIRIIHEIVEVKFSYKQLYLDIISDNRFMLRATGNKTIELWLFFRLFTPIFLLANLSQLKNKTNMFFARLVKKLTR